MSEQAKTKSTGIVLPIESMERLNSMAQDDFRDRSSEIAFLIDEEWKRRQMLNATAPSARKPERN